MDPRRTGADRPAFGPDSPAEPVFRVILRMDVTSGSEAEFERVWAEVAEAIAAHPENLGQWLMRGCEGPSVYYVVSDWRNEPAFRRFERGPQHQEHRRRLDRFRRGGWMIATEVLCSLPPAGSGGDVPARTDPVSAPGGPAGVRP